MSGATKVDAVDWQNLVTTTYLTWEIGGTATKDETDKDPLAVLTSDDVEPEAGRTFLQSDLQRKIGNQFILLRKLLNEVNRVKLWSYYQVILK